MEYENRIKNVIESAFKNLNSFLDVSTVIGKPFKTDTGEYLIPFCKVTLGVLAGGGEYGKVTIFKKNSDLPFSAGNGTVVSIKPCGFLIKENSEEYKILSSDKTSYEKILDKATDIFSNIYENNKKENN